MSTRFSLSVSDFYLIYGELDWVKDIYNDKLNGELAEVDEEDTDTLREKRNAERVVDLYNRIEKRIEKYRAKCH